MSAFTLYAALSEGSTAVHRHTPARELAELYPVVCVPVSGDMLAVLERGTKTQRTKRRRAVISGRSA